MDTRSKILNGAGELSIGPGATLVTGYFDVLRGESVRELEKIGPHPLVAAVLDDSGTILPSRVRAELAAGLRSVDYVVITGRAEFDALVSALRPANVVRLEEADRRRAAELKERVKRRHVG